MTQDISKQGSQDTDYPKGPRIPRVQTVRVRCSRSALADLQRRCDALGFAVEEAAAKLLESVGLLEDNRATFGRGVAQGDQRLGGMAMDLFEKDGCKAEKSSRSITVPITRKLHLALRKCAIQSGWKAEVIASEFFARAMRNATVLDEVGLLIAEVRGRRKLELGTTIVVPQPRVMPHPPRRGSSHESAISETRTP